MVTKELANENFVFKDSFLVISKKNLMKPRCIGPPRFLPSIPRHLGHDIMVLGFLSRLSNKWDRLGTSLIIRCGSLFLGSTTYRMEKGKY